MSHVEAWTAVGGASASQRKAAGWVVCVMIWLIAEISFHVWNTINVPNILLCAFNDCLSKLLVRLLRWFYWITLGFPSFYILSFHNILSFYQKVFIHKFIRTLCLYCLTAWTVNMRVPFAKKFLLDCVFIGSMDNIYVLMDNIYVLKRENLLRRETAWNLSVPWWWFIKKVFKP